MVALSLSNGKPGIELGCRHGVHFEKGRVYAPNICLERNFRLESLGHCHRVLTGAKDGVDGVRSGSYSVSSVGSFQQESVCSVPLDTRSVAAQCDLREWCVAVCVQSKFRSANRTDAISSCKTDVKR
jgi:hypothetical protein